MLLKQEKIADQTEALDELRAKRYQEAKEREWRRTQLAIAQKQKIAKEDVNRVRRQQIEFKAQNMAEQACREKLEFEQVLDWQQKQTAIEHQAIIEKQRKSMAHKDGILAQIRQKEIEKAAARKAFLAEGQVIIKNAAAEKVQLERIKAQKLAQLEAAGVPSKYRTELQKKKVLVSSIH